MPRKGYVQTEEHRNKMTQIKRQMAKDGLLKTLFQKGHVPSDETREKMGCKGSKSGRWKGGITYDKKAYRNNYRKQNLEKSLKYMRAWKKAHLQKVNIYTINYRARLRKAEGSFTAKEWQEKIVEYDNKCALCGQETKLTIDHIVPISRGGSNWIANIQPLCGHCNYTKQDRLEYDSMV